MHYYFPSAIESLDFTKADNPVLKYHFDSGKSALKYLLRSLGLEANNKIAIPAFVCSDVKQCVEAEQLSPVLFDLKDDKTFWTDYDFEKLEREGIKAIILVHLYGFLHPDTKKIVDYCKSKNLKLIHDAAQSYGIDETLIDQNSNIVYSFGPGKATTAAGGGMIKAADIGDYLTQVKKAPFLNFQNRKAVNFLKSRLYRYNLSRKDLIVNYILNIISKSDAKIYQMSEFQKQAASYILNDLVRINGSRKKNYNSFAKKLKDNPDFVLYDDGKGSYFKAVIFVENDPGKFKKYLSDNGVPYYALFGSGKIDSELRLPNFRKYAGHFIEISTEASIPETEIDRIGNLIAAY